MALTSTVDGLIDRIKRDGSLSSRGPFYTVGAAYTAGTTSLVVKENFTHIGVGAIIAVDHELFYVQAASQSTKTLTVIPGYLGSDQANHSEDAIIEVDPRFPRCMISDFMQEEILSWEKQLWRVTPLDISSTPNGRSYDLGLAPGEEVYFLLDARAKPLGDQSSFWNFSWTGNAWPHVNARLIRNMDVTEFASGYAIQITEPLRRSTEIRVAIAQPFDLSTFDPATDLIADVGLSERWLEILEWGARYRMLHGVTAGRVDWRRGSMARESEEVSVFDVMRAADHAKSIHDVRLSEAGLNLRAEWPYREVR